MTESQSSLKSTSWNSQTRVASVRRHAWAWLCIFILALAVRLLYLRQIRGIPFFDTPVGDAASYDRWAVGIAEGDWLGSETFYQAPAYPYFLGILYSITGRSLLAVRVVQAVMGALSCVLLGFAGRAFVSRSVGIAAGFLLAIYPPAIFFDGLIQKTSLGLLLLSALLWRLGVLQTKTRWSGWLTIGILLGLLGLTRENALLLGPVMLGWIGLAFRATDLRVRLGWTFGFTAGLMLVLLPVGFRNLHVGGEFALTTVQAGPNFYIGNHAEATGRYVPLVKGHESPPFERQDAKRLAEAAVGRTLSDGEVSDYWLSSAWAYIRGQPVDWMLLLCKKGLLTFNAYEITDVEGYNVYRSYSLLLAGLGSVWHFGVLAPLAVAGAVITWPDRRRHGLLLVIAAVLAMSVILFYVFGRYRFPLAAVLFVYAGAGVVRIGSCVRKRQYTSLSKPVAAMLIAGVLCNLRINPERRLDAMGFANLGIVLAKQGRMEAAIGVLQIALEENPDSAEVYYNLGLAHQFQREHFKAIERLVAAKTLDPTLIEVDYQLGVAYEATGDRKSARKHYQQALEINPNDNEAAAGLKRINRK